MISAVILTRNSAATLQHTLESLTSLPEVILVDNGSTDNTQAIAQQFANTRWVEHEFTNFGHLRNFGADQSQHDWILMIDSDEALSPELREWLQSFHPTSGTVYSFPFRNYYRGKWIRACGWWPDRHIRLYNRKDTRYRELRVHESLELDGLREEKLVHPFEHDSYQNCADFTRKMHSYATLFAEEYKDRKKAGLHTSFTRGCWTFFRSYFLRKGIFYGCNGFLISFYQAATAYFKYRLLWEKQNPPAPRHNPKL